MWIYYTNLAHSQLLGIPAGEQRTKKLSTSERHFLGSQAGLLMDEKRNLTHSSRRGCVEEHRDSQDELGASSSGQVGIYGFLLW